MGRVTLTEQGVCNPVQQSSDSNQLVGKKSLLGLDSVLFHLDFLTDRNFAALCATERRYRNAYSSQQPQTLI